jgi:hypothetical protein
MAPSILFTLEKLFFGNISMQTKQLQVAESLLCCELLNACWQLICKTLRVGCPKQNFLIYMQTFTANCVVNFSLIAQQI